ncbi:GSCOCT00014029001.2-RA-CDS [Cotesia congregata]|uniref:Cc_17a_2 n=1 Tax=Cotesia congregata TaxID=51543 RepID=A0A8J2MFL5_COTCN|nr:GSCOCT00014029001.2-RA-CDS [Cotesia congregata]CAG5088386.1 Cc_17a_2 [Cotesia congregata]
MEFFTNPFQGLIVAETQPGQPIKIIRDYVNLNGNVTKSYDCFKQRDYVQLPGKLIQSSKIGKETFEFVSAAKSASPSVQTTSNLAREVKQRAKQIGAQLSSFNDRSLSVVDSDDSTSLSTLQSSNGSMEVDQVQKSPSVMAFNDLQSVATSNTNFKSSEADALSSAPSSFYNVNLDDNESVVSSDHNDRSNAMSGPSAVDKKTVATSFDKTSAGSPFSDNSKKNYRKYMPNH